MARCDSLLKEAQAISFLAYGGVRLSFSGEEARSKTCWGQCGENGEKMENGKE